MNLKFQSYLLIALLALFSASCRQAKYVGEGNYLLKDNEILFEVTDKDDDSKEWASKHELIDEYDMSEYVRPTPNSGLKLFIYNRIDSTRYKKQVERKTEKVKKKNAKKKAKEDKKNKKRIEKARRKGKTHYKKKVKNRKSLSLGWRYWIISNWGEAPVILDTAKISKSKKQMSIYLSQKGFKYAQIKDSIEFDEKKQKATVKYFVTTGRPYIINDIKFDDIKRNRSMLGLYNKMKKKEGTDLKVGNLLDEDVLEKERTHYTKYLKDNAYFGFTKNYINFVVDTTVGDYKANLVIYIKEKRIDSTTVLPHKPYTVDKVTFRLHNPDSLSFKDFEAYKQRCRDLGIDYYSIKEGYALLDTLFISDTLITKHFFNFNPDYRKRKGVKLFEKNIDTNLYYKGYFIYNETPYVKPYMLDKQNFLEHTNRSFREVHYAKDYYIDRSYKSLLRLDVFSRINPTVEISPDDPRGSQVDVYYDLTPTKKQQFTIEPRATNTNSILGVSGGITYINKNLSRGANAIKINISGGFQSQPLIVGEDSDENLVNLRGLNTFEWGPEITYSLKKFFPITKKMQEGMSKRSFPSTDISTLYNYQKRSEFKRHIAELTYKWKFSSPNQTQIFTVIPLRFNYVEIQKDSVFDAGLKLANDPFLINSYSDFLSIGVLNLGHHYNNLKKKKAERKTPHTFDNNFNLSAAGLIVNTFEAAFDDSLGFVESFAEDGKRLFNVPYAQFYKGENTFTVNQVVNRNHNMAYRFIAGAGYAYGNGISLPYTQSFVAGGSNDIRAFSARTMAPGSTKTYADSNATTTQIGDMKLELNIEWRFKFSKLLHGALFVDMGNIWKIKQDPLTPNDPGVFQFNSFYKQVAIGTGFGLRVDLEFLIVRLDLAWSLHNPYLPEGERWWTTGKADYKNYFKTDPEDPNKIVDYIQPHPLRLNFGIGYPF